MGGKRKSQSLRADQGSADPALPGLRVGAPGWRRNPSVLIRALPTACTASCDYRLTNESQSLRADQGSADCSSGLWRVHVAAKSQSLRADQGSADLRVWSPAPACQSAPTRSRNPSVLIRTLPTQQHSAAVEPGCPGPSQSLGADQGSADGLVRLEARGLLRHVAIPPC